MPKLFRLHEHNFQNVQGDAMGDMAAFSKDGWEINTCIIAFPYIHVLWEKDMDAVAGAVAAPADHTPCQSELAAVQKERDEEKAAHEQTAQELDDAKRDAGALAAQRDEFRHQAAQLQTALAEAQKAAAPPPAPAAPPAAS